ncbi:unnamed protein product [Paramecium sonneborni]|uniref:Homeodomain protein n=1 Tax=Paramecium sonneborni TaxID=65129 RepID=A0A8S1QGV2_9CILI|nr:unnamed protein product [Paramecium sonneborni]
MKMDGSDNAEYLNNQMIILQETTSKKERNLQRKAKKIHVLNTQKKTESLKRNLNLDSTDTTSIKQKVIKKRNKICENNKQRKSWSVKEDQQLKLALELYGTNWIQIATTMGNRNPSQCAQRWKRIKPQDQKKRKHFNIEEDQLILDLVKKYRRNWSKIAKFLPEKTSKQIRERFINKLNPQIIFKPFTDEEDQIIINAYKEIGSKWTKIQGLLVGRPENMIKNRFYSYLRQKFLNIQNPYYTIHQKKVIKNKNQQSQNNQLQDMTEEKQFIQSEFQKENQGTQNQCNNNNEIQTQEAFQTNQHFQTPCQIFNGNFTYPQYQYYQTPVALFYTQQYGFPINIPLLKQNQFNSSNIDYQQPIFGQNVTHQIVFLSNS